MTVNKNPDDRPAYQAPEALRLDRVNKGMGDCVNTGSGDSNDCMGFGNGANGVCTFDGNSPGGLCSFYGHSYT